MMPRNAQQQGIPVSPATSNEAPQRAVRRRYKRHTGNAIRRVLEAYEKGEDWKVVARAHEVPETTAATWIKNKDQTPKKRGGNR
jgi:hypothetical protein